MRKIPLTKGYVALVDDADYPKLAGYSWQVRLKRGRPTYASRCYGTTFMMHREILGLGSTDPEVDHINGNPLDNRRANLRLATDRQQAQNIRACGRFSSYKGVQWNGYGRYKDRQPHPWRSRIRLPRSDAGVGRKISLGSFATEVEAARAYDAAALKYHGEFARLNFPDSRPLAAVS